MSAHAVQVWLIVAAMALAVFYVWHEATVYLTDLRDRQAGDDDE